MQADIERATEVPDPEGIADTGRKLRLPALEGKFLAFLFAGIALLYVATAVRNHSQSDDAFKFASEIEGDFKIARRQLLFLPVMQGIYRVFSGLGIVERSFTLISVVSALFAAGTVVMFVLLLHRRFDLDRRVSLTGGALLAVMYGWWRFSAEVEVYSMGIFAATVLLYLAAGSASDARAWVWVGVVGALAFFSHALNLITVVVAVPVLLVSAGKRRQLVTYLAVMVPVIAIVTLSVYAAGQSDDEGFNEFYSSQTTFGLSGEQVVRAGLGAGQSVLSANFLFGYDDFADTLADAVPNRSLTDEVYLGDRLAEGVVGISTVTLGLAVLTLLGVAYLAIRGLAKRWRQPLVLALLVNLVAVSLLQIFRAEGSDGPESWMFTTVPFVALLVVGFAARPAGRLRGPVLLTSLVLIVAVHNGIGMATQYSTASDRNATKAEWVVDNLTERDVVLTSEGTQFFRYLNYHAEAEVVHLVTLGRQGENLEAVVAALEAGSRAVFATADVFDVPAPFADSDPGLYDELVALGDSLRSQFEQVTSDDFGGVFRLTR